MEPPVATLKEDRPISTDEASVVTWMLLHASVGGALTHLVSFVPSLRIVGRCSCGCPSVDFAVKGQTPPFQVIADGTGQNRDGLEIGVTIWGRYDVITGLEVYDGVGHATSLPLVSSLRAW
jgi:hypothetical protein